ncbi:MAG: hypothetical protein C0415_06425 [Thermodesulfovibrio sp.]|nr:hypothetical protein [Thermodesulfovibrio sp.]
MRALIAVFLFLSMLYASEGLCEIKCVDSEGEAAIVNNDIPSAKTEAVARAKWAAIEQSVGVEVKAQTIVQNMALVDDAISKQIRGVITGHKIVREETRKDTVWVKINACIEPTKAKEAAASLALNNSIAVFIPAKKPKVMGESEEIRRTPHGKTERHGLITKDEYEETNILSETLIGKLTEQGFTVTDVAPTHAMDAQEIENAVKSGNFLSLRSLMYKFLSNIILIGKIDYTISTRKGQDVGYGISMPFNNVTVRLTYRIVSRDSTGKIVILTAAAEQGKGLANNVEDAAANGMKDLAERLVPTVLDKVSQYIKGIAKKVQLKVSGVTDVNTNFELKEALQQIAWVTNVEEKALGEFTVSYPENTIYLANSINQKGNFKVVNFSPYSITVEYQK